MNVNFIQEKCINLEHIKKLDTSHSASGQASPPASKERRKSFSSDVVDEKVEREPKKDINESINKDTCCNVEPIQRGVPPRKRLEVASL